MIHCVFENVTYLLDYTRSMHEHGYTHGIGTLSNLYHIETVNYNTFVHHARFVQTVVVQFYITEVNDH